MQGDEAQDPASPAGLQEFTPPGRLRATTRGGLP